MAAVGEKEENEKAWGRRNEGSLAVLLCVLGRVAKKEKNEERNGGSAILALGMGENK